MTLSPSYDFLLKNWSCYLAQFLSIKKLQIEIHEVWLQSLSSQNTMPRWGRFLYQQNCDVIFLRSYFFHLPSALQIVVQFSKVFSLDPLKFRKCLMLVHVFINLLIMFFLPAKMHVLFPMSGILIDAAFFGIRVLKV